MHSHFGLQEQNLLAAPLIVREASAINSGIQEAVILLEDFSWTKPSMLLEELRKPKPAMSMPGGSGGMNMSAGAKMDLNDITYDTFLANDRTLADPQIFDVEKGAEVRLRIINAAASTNFMIDLGAIEGTVVTVDGNPVAPLKVRQFPLAIAQRVDIVVRLPDDGKSVPVLARGEVGRCRPAWCCARQAPPWPIMDMATMAAPPITLMDETKLRALQPYANRPIDRSVPVDLTGTMMGYVWGMECMEWAAHR